MHERQVYVNNDTNERRCAFAGSIGANNSLYDNEKLQLIFDAYYQTIVDDKTVNVNTSFSLQYDFVYDKINDKYVSQTTINEYAEIENDVLTLHFIDNNVEKIATFHIDYDNYAIRHIDDDIPYLIQNDITYYAKNIGIFNLHRKSIFINNECEISDFENRCTYVDKIEAIRQYLLQHLSIMKHELWYNYEYGLPLLQKGLTKAMIDAEVATIIFDCPGVDSLLLFESHIDNMNEYHLSFELLTKYGKLEMIDTL